MRPRSLRWRLGLLYMTVIAVALALTLVVVDLLVERALIDDTAARLEVEAGLIAPTSPGRGNAPITSLAAPDLARALGGQQTAVVILDPTGTTVASEANGASPAVLDARLDLDTYQAIAASGATVDRVVDLAGPNGRALVVAAPIRVSSGSNGKGNGNANGKGVGRGLGGSGDSASTGSPNAIAQLAVSLDEADATLASLRTTLLIVGTTTLLAALGIMFVVTSLGLRPLRRVADVADQVASGDLSARARLPSGSDEIGRLGRAFDGMVDRLDRSFAAQRQFAADASHELRSPLTVLGGYVDVLATGDVAAPGTTDRILGSMRREIDRLSRLASDLLLLTQLEAGGSHLNAEPLDVGDLLVDLGEAAKVMGGNHPIVVTHDGSLPVVADRDRLTQALLNLVDNAVHHAAMSSAVHLSGWREADWIAAGIHNEGPPIPAEPLTHVFDRFYRAAPSGNDGQHAGLGLAITKAIVEASGGSVSATSDETGTQFVVRLPIDPSFAGS
jgi:two-component system OmpR family sensor kinase